ncbi:MAG: GNAT family N-acetyltransferase [Solirubrobacteraceae bacterium]
MPLPTTVLIVPATTPAAKIAIAWSGVRVLTDGWGDGSIVAVVPDQSPEPATPVPVPTVTPDDLGGPLAGRLVRVEPLSGEHEEGLAAAAAGDPEMFAWIPVDMASSRDALREWLRRSLAAAAEGREVPFAIVATDSGAVLGSTRFLELRFEHLRAEIGWTWVTRSAWGTGVNVETKLLLLGRAFEQTGLRRVEFKTDARNERSRGALQALGASFEGILRKHMVVRDGGERDSAYYSVTDDDWPRIKAHLRRRLEAHLTG